ncbi:PstS family phosphate ABC transporter substrate-binding protein [Nitrospira sp. NS4]|uniref:PstS family phosphate ABC transporter substrate-binding protein n=1 Tax=Nitrospira sp. NS4 TaxID=3414498 RepID=UPI003C2D7326
MSLAVLGLLAWPVSPTHSEPTTLVKIDGSSTVFPITEAVAEEFQKETRGTVRVTVGISGTGGGFKKFCRGETDVQDASRPISASEMEACRANGIQYYELPVAFDALTLAVSPQATWIDTVTVEELKKIWEPPAQGKVTKWNQIRSTWPDQPLKLFGAGSDSGTFDYFTEAVVGKAKASRGDYTASEDDNTLVQGISNDKHALGYIPYAYFEPNKKRLKAVAVDGGHGPVLPSRETVENGSYQPLSRPMFIYVNATAAGKPEVKRFVEFYLAQAPLLVPQVKYVPLPKEAYNLAVSHFQKGKLGTAFQGISTIGMKIEDLLRREATL